MAKRAYKNSKCRTVKIEKVAHNRDGRRKAQLVKFKGSTYTGPKEHIANSIRKVAVCRSSKGPVAVVLTKRGHKIIKLHKTKRR